MRAFVSMSLFALILAGAPLLQGSEPWLFALVAVAAALAAASVIDGVLSPLGLIFGAAGALGFAVLWPFSPALAGGGLFVGLFAPRGCRARGGWIGLGLHCAVALMSGAAALWLVMSFLHMSGGEWAVSVAVASLVASAPWLLGADDLMARRLEDMARHIGGTARWRLERAAALKRKVEEHRRDVPRKEMRRIDDAFQSLLRLGRVRAKASDGDAGVLDDAIGEHLSALEDGLKAIMAREAVLASIQRGAAQELRQESLGIEAEAEAFSDASPVIRHGEGVQSSP